MPVAHTWSRRPAETQESFAGFLAYLEMGAERSNAKVARKVSKSLGLMAKWSKRHDWVARAADYDNFVAVQEHKAFIERRIAERLEATQRHIQYARVLENRATAALARDEGVIMHAADIARFYDLGIQIERKALDLETPARMEISGPAGAPIEVASNEAPLNFDALGEEELEQYLALMAKLRKPATSASPE